MFTKNFIWIHSTQSSRISIPTLTKYLPVQGVKKAMTVPKVRCPGQQIRVTQDPGNIYLSLPLDCISVIHHNRIWGPRNVTELMCFPVKLSFLTLCSWSFFVGGYCVCPHARAHGHTCTCMFCWSWKCRS